jgi:cold shock CspA family protein/uncharacterized LabA/DUF88 family protein
MTLEHPNGLTRIGIFYDGNYFHHVSNYYNYFHSRKSRISIAGLHEFIRHQIAKEEDRDTRMCPIVDAHYFRGRLSAQEANQRPNQLYYDRVFDDILTGEGVTTHYLPLRNALGGGKQEKGIDVWLALEAFELSNQGKFDVLVLIASDGDYVPLVRKLNALGIRVMILNWDFEYTTDDGKTFATRTSQDLLEEATYPVAMHEIIENRISRNDPMVNSLFVPSSRSQPDFRPRVQSTGTEGESEIKAIKNGYGFIHWSPQDLFFHYSSVEGVEFTELRDGDPVSFTIGVNPENGNPIALNVKLRQEQEEAV